ncbi:hypothetical protein BGW42_004083 [Actinomortierella wolfii]|nr:hypothetical protein BGW42_004083 [Actinomortierella wolfii]
MDNHSRYPFPLQQSFLLHQNPIVQKPQSAKLAGALNATKRIQRRQQQQLQHYQQQQQHFQHSVDKESAIPQNGSFLQRFPGSKTAHTDAESGHHPQLVLQIPLNYSQVSLEAGRNDSVISPLTGTSTLTSYSEDDRNSGFYGSTSPLKRAFSMGSLPSFKSALRGGSRHFPYQKIAAVETAVTAVYPTAPTMDNQEQTEQFIESLEYAIERAQQLRDQLRKEHQCYPSSLTPIPMPDKDMASPSTANTLIPGPLSDGTAHAGVMHTSGPPVPNDDSLPWHQKPLYDHQRQQRLCICTPSCVESVETAHEHQQSMPSSALTHQQLSPCPGLVAFMRTRRLEDQQNLRRTRWAAIIYTILSTTAIALALCVSKPK